MARSRRATAGGRGPFPETYGQWWTILEALPREALFEVASTFCAGLISLSRTTEQMEEQNVAIREEFQRTAGGPDAPSSADLQRPVSAIPIFRGVETILEHAAVLAADPYADAVQSQLARVTGCRRVLTGQTHSVFTEALRERSQRTPPGNRMVWAKTRGGQARRPKASTPRRGRAGAPLDPTPAATGFGGGAAPELDCPAPPRQPRGSVARASSLSAPPEARREHMTKALGQAAERNRGVSKAVLETAVVPSRGAPGITPAPPPQRCSLSSVARVPPGITRAPLPSHCNQRHDGDGPEERPWRHLNSRVRGEVEIQDRRRSPRAQRSAAQHPMEERVNQANVTLQWPTPVIPWNTPVRPRSPSVGLCQEPVSLCWLQRSRQQSSSRSRSPLRRRPAVHLQPAKTSGKGKVGRGKGAGKAKETARPKPPSTPAPVEAREASSERSNGGSRPSPGRS